MRRKWERLSWGKVQSAGLSLCQGWELRHDVSIISDQLSIFVDGWNCSLAILCLSLLFLCWVQEIQCHRERKLVDSNAERWVDIWYSKLQLIVLIISCAQATKNIMVVSPTLDSSPCEPSCPPEGCYWIKECLDAAHVMTNTPNAAFATFLSLRKKIFPSIIWMIIQYSPSAPPIFGSRIQPSTFPTIPYPWDCVSLPPTISSIRSHLLALHPVKRCLKNKTGNRWNCSQL